MIEFDLEPHGEFNKFSPNLYAYTRKRRIRESGFERKFYVDQDGHYWLGFLDDGDWFVGARVMAILCEGTKVQEFAHRPGHLTLVEAPDFIDRYQRDGRCAIDPDHRVAFIGDEERFSHAGDLRTCRWCGASHRREEIEVTETRTRWAPVTSAEMPSH